MWGAFQNLAAQVDGAGASGLFESAANLLEKLDSAGTEENEDDSSDRSDSESSKSKEVSSRNAYVDVETKNAPDHATIDDGAHTEPVVGSGADDETVDHLQEEIDKLDKKNHELIDSVDSLIMHSLSDEEHASKSKDGRQGMDDRVVDLLERLKTAHLKLETSEEGQKQLLVKIAQLQETNEKYANEISSLSAELKFNHKQAIDLYEKDTSELKQQIEELQWANKDADEEIDRLSTQLTMEMNNNVNKKEAESRLRNSISAENSFLSHQAATLQTELEELKEKHASLMLAQETQNQECEVLRESLAAEVDKNHRLASINALRSDLDEMKSSKEALKKDVQITFEAMKMDMAAIFQQVAATTSAAAEQQCSSGHDEAADSAAVEKDKEIIALRREVEALSETVSSLQRTEKKMREELHSRENDLQTALNDSKERVVQSRKIIEQKDAELADAKQSLARLQQEEHQGKGNDAGAAGSSSATIPVKSGTMTSKVGCAGAAVVTATSTPPPKNTKDAKKQIAMLQKELIKAEAEFQEQVAISAALEKENEKLKGDVEAAKDIRAVDGDVVSLKEQVEFFRAQLEEQIALTEAARKKRNEEEKEHTVREKDGMDAQTCAVVDAATSTARAAQAAADDLEGLQSRYDELHVTLQNMNNSCEALKKQNEQLDGQLSSMAALRDENSTLSEKVHTLAEVQGQHAKLVELFATAQQSILEKGHILQEYTDLNRDLATQVERLTDSNANCQILMQEKDHTHVEEIEQLRKEIETLKSCVSGDDVGNEVEISQLKSELEGASKRAADEKARMKSRLEQFEVKRAEMAEAVAAAQSELNSTVEEKATLLEKYSALEKQNKEVCGSLAAAEERIDELRAALESGASDVAQQLSLAQQELCEQQAVNAERTAEVERLTGIVQELRAALESGASDIAQQLSSAQQELSEQQAVNAERIAEVERLTGIVLELRAALESGASDVAQQLSSAQQELSEQRAVNAERIAEVERLTGIVQELELRCDALKDVVSKSEEALSQELAHKNALSSAILELTEKLANAERENGELADKLEESEQQTRDRVLESAELHQKAKEVSDAATEAEAKLQEISDRLEDVKGKLVFAENEKDRLVKKSEKQSARLKDLSAQVEKKTSEAEEFKKRAGMFESQLQVHVLDSASLHETTNAAEQSRVAAEEELAHTKAELEIARASAVEAQAAMEAATAAIQQQLDSALEELGFQTTALQASREEAQTARGQVQVLAAEMDNASAREQQLQQSVNELKSFEQRAHEAEEALSKHEDKKKRDVELLRKQNERIAFLTREKNEYMEMKFDLEKQLDNAHASSDKHLDQLEAELNRTVQARNNIEEELREERRKLSEAVEREGELRVQLAELSRGIEQRQEEQQQSQSIAATLLEQEAVQAELDSLRTQCVALKQERDHLQDALQAAEFAVQAAKNSVGAKEAMLQKKLGEALAEISRLEEVEHLQLSAAVAGSNSSRAAGTPAQRTPGSSGVVGAHSTPSAPASSAGGKGSMVDIELGGSGSGGGGSGSGVADATADSPEPPYSPGKGSKDNWKDSGVPGVHPTVVHFWSLMRTHLPWMTQVVGDRPPRIGQAGKAAIVYVLVLHIVLWLYMSAPACGTAVVGAGMAGKEVASVSAAALRPLPPH